MVHHPFDVPSILCVLRSQHSLCCSDLHQPLHRDQRQYCHICVGAVCRWGTNYTNHAWTLNYTAALHYSNIVFISESLNSVTSSSELEKFGNLQINYQSYKMLSVKVNTGWKAVSCNTVSSNLSVIKIMLFNTLTSPNKPDFFSPAFEWGEPDSEEGVPHLPSFLPWTRTHRHGQEPGYGRRLSETGYGPKEGFYYCCLSIHYLKSITCTMRNSKSFHCWCLLLVVVIVHCSLNI